MAMPAGYKPSPLGYGSPRSSPFRRPESPSAAAAAASTTSPSPSPSSPTASRQITPTKSASGGGPSASLFTPSRLFSKSPTSSSSLSSATPTQTQTYTPTQDTSDSRTPTAATFTPSSRFSPPSGTVKNMAASLQSLGSPPRLASSLHHHPHGGTTTASIASMREGNALSQLQPAQVRTLRDGFQLMDRDSDGVVNREDVADMLTQLGLPAKASDISQFFPPGAPQTLTLATFLNSIATSLAALSPAPELLAAFSAFDEDDSGQVDLAELREALVRTAPEPGERAPSAADVDKVLAGFSGRRAFGRKKPITGTTTMATAGLGGSAMTRKEVFRYQEFVNSVTGTGGGNGGGSAEQVAGEHQDGE